MSCSAIPHSTNLSGNFFSNSIKPVSKIKSASKATIDLFFDAKSIKDLVYAGINF